MKDFVVLIAALFALAQARPQYNYNPPPQISIPSGSYGGPNGGLIANGGITGGGGSFISGSGSGSYVSGGNTGGLIGGGGGSIGIVGGGGSGGLITGSNTGGLIGGGGLVGGGGGGLIGGGGGGLVGGGGGGLIGGGGGSIQKHIYVHVAPPEPEEIRPHQQVNLGQVTKHYKIIFIKAPSPPSYIPPTIAAQLQNREKTLIYVLVKRPDDIPDISIPTVAPTKPSKPEVYFIRYKARKGVSGGGGGSVITTGGGGGGGSIITGGSGTGTITNVIGGGGTNVISSGGGTGVGVSVTGSGGGGGTIISSGGTGGLTSGYGPPGQSGPYK